MMRKQFEYKHLWPYDYDGRAGADHYLEQHNELGQDGWEFVGVIHIGALEVHVFKREV